MRWKLPLFAAATLLAFLGLVEAVLWAAGVPTLLSERDPFSGFSEQVHVYEADAARDVYHTAARAVRHSFNYQEFALHKPANGFRLFVLGGSSTFGFPWGERAAFTRALGEALQAAYPETRIEAVNAAAMSYGSHRLRILAHELLGYEPDLLVIDTGHNEFIERRFYRDVLTRAGELDRLSRLLYRWRLYSALARLAERGRTASRPHAEAPAGKTTGELLGFDVVREYAVDVDDTERAEVTRQFEDNLRDIVTRARAAGVGVILCTATSNLSGWVPNQSVFAPDVPPDARQAVQQLVARARAGLDRGDAATAAVALEQARALAPGYADTQYLLGRAYAALGRWDDARTAYALARDCDAKPSRAIRAFNDVIRRLARESGAHLLDVEAAFERAAPHGIPGFDLFEDYVHPKPAAHQLIALELWRLCLEQGIAGGRRPADDRAFWQALHLPGPQLDSASDAPEAAAGAATPALLFNLAVVLENQSLYEQALEKYRACVALEPRYYVAYANIGRLLQRERRFEEAAAAYGKALEVEPGHVQSLVGLGEALRSLGRIDETLAVLGRAVRTDPRSAPAWDALGGVLAERGRQPEAEQAFRRAAELDDENPDVRANLGFALLFQKRLDEAQAAFGAGLALAPDHVRCRNGLAAVLAERGQYAEAERMFHESLRLDPADAFARGGLAVIERRRRGR